MIFKFSLSIILFCYVSNTKLHSMQNNRNSMPNLKLDKNSQFQNTKIPNHITVNAFALNEKKKIVSEIFAPAHHENEIKIPTVNKVSDLILHSWRNVLNTVSQNPKSSISILYAGFKSLEGYKGINWRLVFCLKNSKNKEFIGLDVAVLENGTVDIFRNIQTRNLIDIELLFKISIKSADALVIDYLKESFLHNAPMIINSTYDMIQASESHFKKEWVAQRQNNSENKSSITSSQNKTQNLLNTFGDSNDQVEESIAIGSYYTINDSNF